MPAAPYAPPDPPSRPRLAAVPDVGADRHALLVERLRARIRGSGVTPFDGMVWLAHLDRDAQPRLFTRLPDPVSGLDELFLLDLLSTLDEIGLPGVAVAVWRADGTPVAVDRRFARDLTLRLSDERRPSLDAVLIVHAQGHRLVRPGRAAKAGKPAAL